jgi:hypothetical protein
MYGFPQLQCVVMLNLFQHLPFLARQAAEWIGLRLPSVLKQVQDDRKIGLLHA